MKAYMVWYVIEGDEQYTLARVVKAESKMKAMRQILSSTKNDLVNDAFRKLPEIMDYIENNPLEDVLDNITCYSVSELKLI